MADRTKYRTINISPQVKRELDLIKVYTPVKTMDEAIRVLLKKSKIKVGDSHADTNKK